MPKTICIYWQDLKSETQEEIVKFINDPFEPDNNENYHNWNCIPMFVMELDE